MSETQHEWTAGSGAPGGTGQDRDWWSRRPRRSTNDRKIAGVAGGLGRTFGVDPVLFRVGFAILAFTGFGLLLYVLGWLLLPADGDEVSPGEALLGRGQSSTPPAVAVGLGIAAIIFAGGTFSWGLPVVPLVIGGIIAVVVLRKRSRMGGCAGRDKTSWSQHQAGQVGGHQQWADEWSAKVSQKAESWGAQAEQWVARQPWSGTTGPSPSSRKSEPASPFDKPAFWEEDAPTSSTGRPAAGRVNLSKDTPAEPVEPTPPAWDPLGVAPFAWDLPEPTPIPPAPPARRARSVVGRVTMGAVLLIGGLATVGTIAGWWHLTWAGVSAIALTVVAIGLLIGSLRGRGHSLIGPGIFLSAVTLALTVTGIDGTSGYGQQTWTPTTTTGVQDEYVLNGGQGTLDLRNLTVPAGDTVTTEVEVRAGQATVLLPADTKANVTCTTNAGEVDCLGNIENGLHRETTATQPGSSDNGQINLSVHVGAGQAEVRNG
jgi:phage shock protein PspC (stress-responsive transcriptional regulator)